MSNNIEQSLRKAIINYGLPVLEKALINPKDIEKYVFRIYQEHLNYPIPKSKIDIDNWLIPESYKNMDIENFLINRCPKENHERLIQELNLYKKNNMISILKTMKYIVDVLRENNVVWGVGRGSSVASYALFLIGIHKIDSIKYNLPIEEFFKEK